VLLSDFPEIDVLKSNGRLMMAETAEDNAEQHGSHIISFRTNPQAGTIFTP